MNSGLPIVKSGYLKLHITHLEGKPLCACVSGSLYVCVRHHMCVEFFFERKQTKMNR